MCKCKPVATPIDKRSLAPKSGYKSPDKLCTQYQSAFGSLMYTLLGTQSDFAFSVSVISRYRSNADASHWQAVKRVFQYIKGSISFELTFCCSLLPLSDYSDAD